MKHLSAELFIVRMSGNLKDLCLGPYFRRTYCVLTLLVRGGLIQPPPTKYCFKSGYLGARTPQTHWLFLNMYEKWYTNVFGVISLRGPPRGPTFFLAPPEKMLKSTVFELEQWFLHQNGPFFHQEFNGKGLWVLGSQFCTKKLKNISEFQNSWNFWIFGSWTQPGAWHMIVPFWSWNLSDTTHVRSHTKFQLVWAIITAFTRGGLNQPPPLTQMWSWDPLTIRVKEAFFLFCRKLYHII